MTTCNIPPKGWNCSREAGHWGPCAARSDTPYDDYVDKVVLGRTVFACPDPAYVKKMSTDELRSLLVGAWLSGLAYSLELMPKEK